MCNCCKCNSLTTASTSPEIVIAESVNIIGHPCVDHCYNFERNFDDSCGNVNGSSSNLNFISYNDGTDGVPNLSSCVAIDGTEQAILLDEGINVNPKGFAISVWFRTTTIEDNDNRFFAKSSGHNIQNHIVSAQLAGGKLKFRLKLGDNMDMGTVQYESTGDPIIENTWYHAVFWFDGCEVRMYLNGTEDSIAPTGVIGVGLNNTAAFAKGQTVFQSSQAVALGSQPFNPGAPGPDNFRTFNGCMDQLIVWNHPISEAVISALYNNGDGRTSVPKEISSAYASFKGCGCKKSLLSKLTQELTIISCYPFECAIKECETLTIELIDKCCPSKKKILVKKINNLDDFPGTVELLNTVGTEAGDGTIFTYTVGLCLDTVKTFGCLVDVTHYKVRLSVENAHDIQKPLDPFSIIGCRRTKKINKH